MPPRSLTGVLFGAATALWGLLVGVLVTLLAPEGGGPSLGFWLGVVLAAAVGAGWGATAAHRLLRVLSTGGRSGGVVRFAAAGGAVLLLAGATTLAGGLLLTVLVAGGADTWGALRQAFARPAALSWPVAGVALIGVPIGAAAGVVLRAMAVPNGGPGGSYSSDADGSPRRSLR